MERDNIPQCIMQLIAGKPYELDETGMSGSTIMIFDDMVLKIEEDRGEEDPAVLMMRWLKGKLPVPEVLSYEKEGGYRYLLMTKIPGEMSCNDHYHEHPDELLKILSDALRMFWEVDISGCPVTRDLDAELKEARYRIDKGLVDIEDSEPGTFGENGSFKDPEDLYQWLDNNRPAFEPVLSHGDFCLPNIFIKDGKVSGFIDVGRAGICDKWKDIALCYRSLMHNFDGTFGGKVYPDFKPDMLFEQLGIGPDRDKIRYYILLDELF